MIGDCCVECSSIPNHFLVEETYVSELISFWVPIWKRGIFFLSGRGRIIAACLDIA